jgi:hypothetical protein
MHAYILVHIHTPSEMGSRNPNGQINGAGGPLCYGTAAFLGSKTIVYEYSVGW